MEDGGSLLGQSHIHKDLSSGGRELLVRVSALQELELLTIKKL